MPIFEEEKQTERILIKKANRLQEKEEPVFDFNFFSITAFGWNVCLPIILCVFLGRFLDKTFPIQHFSWTLNSILFGLILGLTFGGLWLKKAALKNSKKTQHEKDV